MPKMYQQRFDAIEFHVRQVQAIQLNAVTDSINNLEEVAQFCDGRPECPFSGQEHDKHDVCVVWVPALAKYASMGQWVYADSSGLFYIVNDKDFTSMYDVTDHSLDPRVCHWCLSLPDFTPMANEGDKQCPECHVPYSGPRRSDEYGILLAAGLIRRN